MLRRIILCAAVCAAGLAESLRSQEAGPASPAAPLTDQQVADVLKILREIATNPNRPEDQRGDAILAHARVLSESQRPAEAIALSQELLQKPCPPQLASAAMQAACLTCLARDGSLRDAMQLLAGWAGGPNAGAAALLRGSIEQGMATPAAGLARQTFPAAAGASPPPWAVSPPRAVEVRLLAAPPPAWYPKDARPAAALNVIVPKIETPRWYPEPGKAPAALNASLPKIEAPRWYPEPGKAPAALSPPLPAFPPPGWYARAAFPLLKPPPK